MFPDSSSVAIAIITLLATLAGGPAESPGRKQDPRPFVDVKCVVRDATIEIRGTITPRNEYVHNRKNEFLRNGKTVGTIDSLMRNGKPVANYTVVYGKGGEKHEYTGPDALRGVHALLDALGVTSKELGDCMRNNKPT